MKTVKMRADAKFSSKKTPADYEKKIIRALELQSIIEPAKKELDELKEFFKSKMENGKTENKIVTPAGVAVLKTSNSYSVAPECVPELKDIFKKNYKTFVKEDVAFKPTAALKELLSDGDYPNIETVRKSVLIKQSSNVVFTGISKN